MDKILNISHLAKIVNSGYYAQYLRITTFLAI